MFWLLLALFVSMIHIIYTSVLCGYLLPYFIINGIYHAPIDLEPNGRPFGSKFTRKV